MSEKDFNIYLNISSEKLSIAAFEEFNSKSFFFKEYTCQTSFKNNNFDFKNLKKTFEKNIFEVEKLTGSFLNDIFLMLETENIISINLSLSQSKYGEEILTKDIQYLIQDAKQQILRSYPNQIIAHILANKYLVDRKEYNFLPTGVNCENFSIDLEFICFPKLLIKKLEELFNDQSINISKIISTNYAKKFNDVGISDNICESGVRVVQGINKQEVVTIPKIIEKKGFFERLFHLFQ